MPPCGRDGCDRPAVSRAKNRWRLCAEHTAEEREKASRSAQAANRRRAATVKPPPVAAAKQEHAVSDRSAPFAGLADLVVELERQVAELEEQLAAARERLADAAAAFVRHLRDRFGVSA